MATKKKAEDVTRAEAICIEQMWGDKTAEEIANELQIPVAKVEAYIAKLEEAGLAKPKPKAVPTNAEKAGFAVHDPTNNETGEKSKSFATSSTGASSDIGDKATEKASKAEGYTRNPRLKNSIHIIDPKRPCR